MRSARCASATALFVVLAALVGCAHHGDGFDPNKKIRGGIGYPLNGPGGFGWSVKLPFNARFTNGLTDLRNMSDESITIVRVEPLLTGHGLKFLGAQIAGLDRTVGLFQIAHRYPPTQRSLGSPVPAEGAVLDPGRQQRSRGYELLLGFEVTAAGRSTVKAVDVTYRTSAGTHTQRIISTVAVCAPKSYVGKCKMEYGDRF